VYLNFKLGADMASFYFTYAPDVDWAAVNCTNLIEYK
jgi:hypothetical protein